MLEHGKGTIFSTILQQFEKTMLHLSFLWCKKHFPNCLKAFEIQVWWYWTCSTFLPAYRLTICHKTFLILRTLLQVKIRVLISTSQPTANTKHFYIFSMRILHFTKLFIYNSDAIEVYSFLETCVYFAWYFQESFSGVVSLKSILFEQENVFFTIIA